MVRANHHRADGRPRAAFSLVELLVVVALVAVLAALLMPMLGVVRERGRRTVCAASVKHLSLAVVVYAQDNDDVMPHQPAWTGGVFGGNYAAQSGLQVLLADYLERKAALKCPSQRSLGAGPWTAYGYYTGGALDQPLSIARAIRGLKTKSGLGTAVGGSEFALFGDVVVLTTYAGAPPLSQNNHWNGDRQAGGNVGGSDGSVRWLPIKTGARDRDAWLSDSGGQYTAGLPYNAVFMTTDGGSYLRKPYGSYANGYVKLGSSGVAIDDFPP